MGSATTPTTRTTSTGHPSAVTSLDRRDEALLARVGRASDIDLEDGFCPRVVCEEKKVNRKMLFLARAVVYLLAFLVPPVLISVVGMRAVESARYEGPPDAARVQAGELPAPPRHDPDKPTAVVLLGNQGSEVTDVLAPYEVLCESGTFNVYAAAPEREAVTLSGGLDVLPQLSLAKLDRRLGGQHPVRMELGPTE